jgi:hypothetical protein
MRFVCAVGVVAALAMGAQAQQTPATEVLPSNVRIVVAGLMCPAGVLRAHQRTAGGMVWTIAREDSNDLAFTKRQGRSGVHVELKSAKGPLRQIELSVSYLAPGARVMPVGATDSKDELKKTFTLSGDGETNVEGNLLVGPAFEITRVHLMSATFADGSVWRARDEDACSVKPDRFLLVGGK